MLAGKVVANSATITRVLKISAVLAPKLLFGKPGLGQKASQSLLIVLRVVKLEMHPVAYVALFCKWKERIQGLTLAHK